MKATASHGDTRVDYDSLCAPFESSADHVLIEAWRKLNKPSGEMKVVLNLSSEVVGKVVVSRIGVPYASESRWVRRKLDGQRQYKKAN